MQINFGQLFPSPNRNWAKQTESSLHCTITSQQRNEYKLNTNTNTNTNSKTNANTNSNTNLNTMIGKKKPCSFRDTLPWHGCVNKLVTICLSCGLVEGIFGNKRTHIWQWKDTKNGPISKSCVQVGGSDSRLSVSSPSSLPRLHAHRSQPSLAHAQVAQNGQYDG